MSDLGAPQQPGTPFFDPPAGQPTPIGYSTFGRSPPAMRVSRGGSRAFVVALLVIACMLLGAVLSWGIKQYRERARLTERNRRVEDAYTYVLAKRNDLANFLTDPRTKLIRLEGRGTARGLDLTVAWQDGRSSGVVIGDSMPLPADGSGYMVWLVPQGGGPPVRGESRTGGSARFKPEAGVTFFEFRALDFAGKVGGFRVTEEQRKDANAPSGRVVYESAGENQA